MNEIYEVKNLADPPHWTVEVPGSKSITNRALLMAALADGPVRLEGVLFSDDSRYFLQSLERLGFHLDICEEERVVTVEGCGGRIPEAEGEIYVGSAGTAARFLTAMLGVSAGTYRILASEQMQKRPMRPLFEALLSLGAQIQWLGEEWHLPVCITGASAGLSCGQPDVTRVPERQSLEPTEMSETADEKQLCLDISESTQFLSGFLLIAPMFPQGLHIRITSEKKDGSYIRITRAMMQEFGASVDFTEGEYRIAPGTSYSRLSYQIEPDVSAACYFYGAAAITGGYAKVKHVFYDSTQGDIKLLDVLRRMGCSVSEEADGISVTGPEPGNLRGIAVDMNDFSDQALTLAAIAPFADTPVEIRHIAHIRQQESDRIHAIVANLKRMGISCEEYEDGVKIYPGQPQACRIDTYEDHRVAMAFSLPGLRADGISIENPGCCRKTFENYFELLDVLTGNPRFPSGHGGVHDIKKKRRFQL
ncbi:MAG: 3-phosphoshikimate 1-carboxyvinyltransferase [Clostridiales bacterium]|nr:3-phosphoshikimate 1-carboxyvinyltransferase [Clostridiales bacterium]